MLLSEKEIVIYEGNYKEFLAENVPDQGSVIDGKRTFGQVPRPFDIYPAGCYKGSFKAVAFPLIPDAEISDRIADQFKGGYRLSDLRNRGNNGQPIPSRDQDGRGYCWGHSGTSGHLLVRARDGLPYVDLSAFSICVPIKNGRDEGGWGAQGVDWQREKGCATSKTWPQQSMSLSNNNATMQAEAAKYKIDEGWWDLAAAQYDRTLTFQQVVSCLLTDNPVVVDYNWWSHSVCAADVVNGTSMYRRHRGGDGKLLLGREFDLVWGMDNPITRGYGIRIWNSWGDSWSDNGMGVLTGTKAVPDGAVCIRTVYASAA